ncbi:hypothetical protein [Fischerella muscicola]|uniref:hypothetical protein n=1 Tax=Fischerella muscicola TaxID=92938 RepID=UPI002155C681|nr:hypothetical protein [Fischerella muscicola]
MKRETLSLKPGTSSFKQETFRFKREIPSLKHEISSSKLETPRLKREIPGLKRETSSLELETPNKIPTFDKSRGSVWLNDTAAFDKELE